MKHLLVTIFLLTGCTSHIGLERSLQECSIDNRYESWKKNKCISDCGLGDAEFCYEICSDLHPYECR